MDLWNATMEALEPFFGSDQVDDSSALDDFLISINSAAALLQLTDDQLRSVIILKLRGPARQILRGRPSLASGTSAELIAALTAHFRPPIDRYSACTKFRECTQLPTETVSEYLTRLRELAIRYLNSRPPPPEAHQEAILAQMEDEILHIFLRGLDPRFRKFVQLQGPKTVDTALSLAQQEELEVQSTEPASKITTAAVQTVTEKPTVTPTPTPSPKQAYPPWLVGHSQSYYCFGPPPHYAWHAAKNQPFRSHNGAAGPPRPPPFPFRVRRRPPGPRPGRGNRIRIKKSV